MRILLSIRKKLKNLLRLNYFDEVKMIHSFLNQSMYQIMIDVGAHIGGSQRAILEQDGSSCI